MQNTQDPEVKVKTRKVEAIVWLISLCVYVFGGLDFGVGLKGLNIVVLGEKVTVTRKRTGKGGCGSKHQK